MSPPRCGQKTSRGKTVFLVKYCSLGPPTGKCSKCNTVKWKEERVNKNVKKGTPIFSLCCQKKEKLSFLMHCQHPRIC